MSNGQRIGVLVAGLAVLVVAFFVLSPGDSTDDTASTPAQQPTTTTPPLSTPTATATTPVAPPQPAFRRIRVRGGKPTGGVRTIKATTGERIRIEVRSPDTTDEVHLHGYDISRDLEPGGRARFSFKADAEGIFDIELEGSHTLIAKLQVQPG